MKTTIRKYIVPSAFAALFVAACPLPAAEADSKPGVHFDDTQKVDVQGALVIYKELSSYELVIDSRAAKVVTPIRWKVGYSNSLSPEDALKLLETRLLERTGIVLTRLDNNRVSVTYNDALPISSDRSEYVRTMLPYDASGALAHAKRLRRKNPDGEDIGKMDRVLLEHFLWLHICLRDDQIPEADKGYARRVFPALVAFVREQHLADAFERGREYPMSAVSYYPADVNIFPERLVIRDAVEEILEHEKP